MPTPGFRSLLLSLSVALPLAVCSTILFAPSPAMAVDRASSYPDESQCTACVARRVKEVLGDDTFYWNGDYGRDARTWIARAIREGRTISHTPTLYAVAVEPRSRWGHVSFVEEVFDDGSVRVSECNFIRRRATQDRIIPPRAARYIYPKEDTLMIADAVIGPPAPPAESPPQTPEAPPEEARQIVPPAAIAAIDTPKQECSGPKSRICKVPPSLVPIYEKVANEEDVPIEMLLAVTSWETGFNTRALATNGEYSCGLAQFNQPTRNWGFASVEECMEPEANLRKLASAYKGFIAKGGSGIRNYACRHNAGPRAGLTCRASQGYGNAVQWAVDNVFAA